MIQTSLRIGDFSVWKNDNNFLLSRKQEFIALIVFEEKGNPSLIFYGHVLQPISMNQLLSIAELMKSAEKLRCGFDNEV